MPEPDNLPSTWRSEAVQGSTPPADLSRTERLWLLRNDQQRRWRRGERVTVETYVQQEPTLFADREALLELLYAEVLLREEFGEHPQPDEYVPRFQNHASQICRLFEFHQALESDSVDSRETQVRARAAETSPALKTRTTPAAAVPGYEILDELGRGGMGVVYKARHLRLGRVVALKMILTGAHAGPDEVVRFLAEAQAVAHLHHPNIVPLFESGQHQGMPWFTLEYLPGGSLAKRLSGVPLPPDAAARLVVPLADAVQHAHDEGILHRDLKPANVLLDEDGTPKITDFGLAKRVDLGSGLTATGTVMGTPSYMAPEQAAGGAKYVGPAADVYALGAVLYECLTGRPPFQGPSAVDVIRQVLADEPVPPRMLAGAVAKDLETICLKCLRKDPAKRYANAAALQEDLTRYLDDQPIRARPVSLPERAAKWVRRRPTAATLIAVALLGGLLLAGGVWQYNRRVRQTERQTRAADLVLSLGQVNPTAVPRLVDDLAEYRDLATPLLRRMLDAAEPDSPQQVHARLALLPSDPARADELAAYVPRCRPTELVVLRDALQKYPGAVRDHLWPVLMAPDEEPSRRLRAACVLATLFPDDPAWNDVADTLAEALAGENTLTLVHWAETLHPVRVRLLRALTGLYRSTRQKLAGRGLELTALVEQASRLERTADLIVRYAPDQPDAVAELLPDMDPRHHALLLPRLNDTPSKTENRTRVVAALRGELGRRIPPPWHDAPLNPSWGEPSVGMRSEIAQAQGLVTERFAFCQTLPLTRFDPINEGLLRCGYRPVKFRPHTAGGTVLVAAIWVRDGRAVHLLRDATEEQVKRTDAAYQKDGLQPIDVAGYRAGDSERYAALWVKPLPGEPERRLYVGVPQSRHDVEVWGPLVLKGFVPWACAVVAGADGEPRCSGVWGKADPQPLNSDAFDLDQAQVAAGALGSLPLDVCVYAVGPGPPRRDVLEKIRLEAGAALEQDPADAEALLKRARASYHLGRDRDTLGDLETLLALPGRKTPEGHLLRARGRARLGQAADARADLAAFERLSPDPTDRVTAAVMVEAYLGEEEVALKRLAASVAARPTDADLLYQAARARAVAADAVGRHQAERTAALTIASHLLAGNPWHAATLPRRLEAVRGEHEARARRHADAALTLLMQAVNRGSAHVAAMRDEDDFAAIRNRREFEELLAQGRLDRRYAAVWHVNGTREGETLCGLSPAASLTRARDLAAQGYRPMTLSVAETKPGTLVTAALWHRPTPSAEMKDAAARRRGGAAATLLLLDTPDPVWPLLKHESDPSTRSYLIHRAAALGVDPAVLVRRFDEERDVTARRALLLALGEYEPGKLPEPLRGPLTGRLLDLFRDDADAGLHGAIDWLLRQRWGKADRLTEIERRLRTSGPPTVRKGAKGWWVNSEGQTLTVVPGPVEFTMGALAPDPTSDDEDVPHRRRIPRSFAVAVRPVTVEEFQRFLEDNPDLTHAHEKRFAPEPGCPVVNVTWFEAAAYCRWLSEKEKVAPDEMCYPGITKIHEGMNLPPDYLTRTGYRLPTEAEMEHVCRAGSETSRFYGDSEELLGYYAWHLQNSRERTWPVGRLKPNDLGLFDVHGNVWNWTQGPSVRQLAARGGPVLDQEQAWLVGDRPSRVLRGGSFDVGAGFLRSTLRYPERPGRTSSTIGFRVARTVR